MKIFILISLCLLSCKKDTEFSLSVKSTQKCELKVTAYYDIKDLKADNSFKYRNSQTLQPSKQTQGIYINPEYSYRVEVVGFDSAETYIYKNREMKTMQKGSFTLIIDKGKIK